MSSTMEKVADFFRSRVVSVEVHPDIKINYHSYSGEIGLKLKDEWNKLLKEVEAHPEIVKERKEQDYGSFGYTELSLFIDGVLMKIEGPHWERREPDNQRRELTITERAESQLNIIMSQNLVWALDNAPPNMVRTFYATVKAAVGEADTDLVTKTTDEVLRRLQIRSLIQEGKNQ